MTDHPPESDRLEQLGHSAPDATQPDHAGDRGFGKVQGANRVEAPLTASHDPIGFAHSAEGCQGQCERVLRDALGAVVGHIADRDAEPFGSLEIDRVHADPGSNDGSRPEPGERVGIEASAGAGDDDPGI